MIKIDVWITFGNGEKIQCGEILCLEPDSHGRIAGEFKYHTDFLNHPHGFSLDPVSLPLESSVFTASRPSGVFAIFEDSLPDDWGKKLLVRKARLERKKRFAPHLLLALGDHGLGALSYGQRRKNNPIEKFVEILDLPKLADAAEKIEINPEEIT